MALRPRKRSTPADVHPEDLAFTEDLVEAPEEVGLAHRNPTLALQHMEAAVARADLLFPSILSREEFRRLRYLISFARLTVFEPGAAGPDGKRGRGDVDVTDELAKFRVLVIDALHNPLRREDDLRKRLVQARNILPQLVEPLEDERQKLVEVHANDFSLAELDAEVGYKSLVSVIGGGGGSGYVFFGGMERMIDAGLTPDYMLTSSFGSIVSSLVGRERPVPMHEYNAWAKSVTYRGVMTTARQRRRHGLTGLVSLQFDQFAEEMFRREDGGRMRLRDLEIPTEMVVSGVRKQSFDRLPSRFRRAELSSLGMRALPITKLGMGPVLAARMWQTAAFIDSRVVKPIVLGGDALTENLNVVDAVSFSAAIPGVLQHESKDPAMWPILDELLAQKDVAALVDGGAASNVPVELAWKRVQDGKLGTRNACVLAWDCFHPQWNPQNLWLQPITQAIQVQMVRNAPYADRVVRFNPTLSAVTLAPTERAFERAIEWGKSSIDGAIPMVKHMLEPVWWDADKPLEAGNRFVPPIASPQVAKPLPPVPESGKGTVRARFARNRA